MHKSHRRMLGYARSHQCQCLCPGWSRLLQSELPPLRMNHQRSSEGCKDSRFAQKWGYCSHNCSRYKYKQFKLVTSFGNKVSVQNVHSLCFSVVEQASNLHLNCWDYHNLPEMSEDTPLHLYFFICNEDVELLPLIKCIMIVEPQVFMTGAICTVQ